MKLLIVDDEIILREKLAGVVRASHLPFADIQMAENAVAALEIIAADPPDVVVSDIRMPVKSGLELAAELASIYPEIPVILVTGYSDFEYARSALRSGVFDYILKPVEPEKLIHALKQAAEKLELASKHSRLHQMFSAYFESNLPVIRRQFVESMLFHRGTLRDEERYRELFGEPYQPARLVVVQCGTSIDGNRLEGEYYCTFLVEKYIAQRQPKTLTYVFGSLMFFFWKVGTPDVFADNCALLTLLKGVQSYVRTNFLGNIVAGISKQGATIGDIQDLRRQASDCLDYQRELGDRYVFYDDLAIPDSSNANTEHFISRIIVALRSGATQQLRVEWGALLTSLEGSAEAYQKTVYLYLVSQVSFLLYELGFESTVVQGLGEACMGGLRTTSMAENATALGLWLEQVREMVAGEWRQRSNIVVNAVRDYIANHYCEAVGLTEVSRAVGRNSSYVSRLIHEQTGKKFTQLLTDKRMSEAKRLLKESSLKINDIAEKVGYCNVRYFNRVFKATLNMSASDYRNFAKTFQ